MIDWQNPYLWNLAYAALAVVPLWLLFRRAGLNPLPALAIFVPLIGTALAVSALAYPRWPVLPVRDKKKKR